MQQSVGLYIESGLFFFAMQRLLIVQVFLFQIENKLFQLCNLFVINRLIRYCALVKAERGAMLGRREWYLICYK